MLPAQDYIEDGEVGNLIALPLQGQSLKNGNSAFIDEKQNAIPDQWKALLSTKRLSKQQIETLMTGWNENSEFANSNTISVDDTKPWARTNTFHKEDVSGKLKIVLSNQIYVSTENLKPRIQNQIRRYLWGYSSVGRAPALQAGGHEFESRYLHSDGNI